MSTRPVGNITKSNGQSSVDDAITPIVPHADVRKSGAVETNQLSPLGQKIFLDRYAMKDMSKRTLAPDDMVIVCVDAKTGQREIGIVTEMDETGGGGWVTVELQDGTKIECLSEHIA